MTLIIAGFEKKKNPWANVWAEKTTTANELKTYGLFAVADSLITSNDGETSRPLLSGLRKIHSIPIKLWKPYFVDGVFRDYFEVHFESECFVAFAGSTLTATHALDVIAEHLSKLRISYDSKTQNEVESKYVVRRDCQYIELRDAKRYTEWDDDMFLPSDFNGLLTADYLADVIEHSINVALKSAKKYRISEKAFKQMGTDFLAGIQCPATGQYRLFTFRMRCKINDEHMMEVFASRQEISDEEVAVLGMRNEFETRAQSAYKDALSAGTSTGAMLFNFLNVAIDEVTATEDVLIDRPAIHKLLENGTLSKVDFMKSPD